MKRVINFAFISYEYPPETSGGGIGTYTYQIAKALVKFGHIVTVFCGTKNADSEALIEGIRIITIRSENYLEFRNRNLKIFSKIHDIVHFDIIESPDYGADGYYIKMAYPTLPYIVKLHTPTYLIRYYSTNKPDKFSKFFLINNTKRVIKKILGINNPFSYNKSEDIEYLNILLADLIVSPSLGLLKRVKKDWKVDIKKTIIFPNIYNPTQEQLLIEQTYSNNRVTIIGKISILKGLLQIINVIPIVLNKNPSLKFRFIGADSFSPDEDKTMIAYIKDKCKIYLDNLEFINQVPLEHIPKYLAETDILVCNSLWENYPTVILEAMSASRIVIGTKVGGIPEIIKNKKNGFLVSTQNAYHLANIILNVYTNKFDNRKIGNAARLFIQNKNNNHFLSTITNTYSKLIDANKI